MKSIFLNGSDHNFHYVYPPETIAALQAEAGLIPTAYSKEQLLADPSIGADADYIFTTWGMPTLTEDEIRLYLPNLKAVFYGAGSVQQFARPFLNCGVQVFSAWAANGVPVAEYTVAQIVLANTGFFQSCAQCSTLEGRIAARSAQRANYDGNYDCAVGLIGAGMIGSMVAERLRDYHIHVMVFDPFLSDERAAQLGVEKTSLERIFTECQTISNHLANNPQTVGMLNYERCFARMLPQATFINTGRGADRSPHPHRRAGRHISRTAGRRVAVLHHAQRVPHPAHRRQQRQGSPPDVAVYAGRVPPPDRRGADPLVRDPQNAGNHGVIFAPHRKAG